MSDVKTLEPGLTKTDKRVLAAIPASYDGPSPIPVEHSATIWQIAEALDTDDLQDVRRTLRGLEHLGYVFNARSASRKRMVWFRLDKGDEAIA